MATNHLSEWSPDTLNSCIQSLSYLIISIYVGNFGVVRPLGQKGILEFSRHKKRLEVEMYNDLVRFTARLEKIVIKYLPRYIHRFMARAKDAVQYTSMRGIDLDSSEEPKYYSR